MKDQRPALHILACYQYGIAFMGEGSPASINFKPFFQRGWYGSEREFAEGSNNFWHDFWFSDRMLL